jgi:hypothetical protein
MHPCGPWILLFALRQGSWVVYGGYIIGLIVSALGRESIKQAKQVSLLLVQVILLALFQRGCQGSKQAIQAIKVYEIKLSSISGGHCGELNLLAPW